MSRTDDPTNDHLRALLAEQTARADGLDQQLSAVLAGVKRIMNGDNHLIAVAEAQQARAEKAEAEAACAEMRAALARSNSAHQAALYDEDFDRDDERDAQRVIDDTTSLLSRPDLGAGMVVVPREVVERVRRMFDLLRETTADRGRAEQMAEEARALNLAGIIADLDALIKKGGG